MGAILSSIRIAQARVLPPRIVIYAPEKWGKTSGPTFADAPVFALSNGENGLKTLIASGQVQPTPHVELFKWTDLIRMIRELTVEQHSYKTLVLDTGNGFETMCAAHVCTQHFQDSWGEHGYAGFGRGDAIAATEWRNLLANLEELRLDKGMTIIVLHHATIKATANPVGKDYDQWKPVCRDKLWSETHKWSDAIVRGGFEVSVKEDKVASEKRCLFTAQSSSAVCGNRYGITEKFMGSSAKEMFTSFITSINVAAARAALQPNGKSVDEWAKEMADAATRGTEALKLAWSSAPVSIQKQLEGKKAAWKAAAGEADSAANQRQPGDEPALCLPDAWHSENPFAEALRAPEESRGPVADDPVVVNKTAADYEKELPF